MKTEMPNSIDLTSRPTKDVQTALAVRRYDMGFFQGAPAMFEQPDGKYVKHDEAAAEILRLNKEAYTWWEAADSEGSRAVMLVRQRRRLQDAAKAALAKLDYVIACTRDRDPIAEHLGDTIAEARALVEGMTERLPNSPEAISAFSCAKAPDAPCRQWCGDGATCLSSQAAA